MANSVEFVLKRAVATRNAQESVQPAWVWDEKTVPQWNADIKTVQTREQAVADGEARLLARRGPLDAALDDLHNRTVQAVTMAKVRYRDDPAKGAVLRSLNAGGQSRSEILDEATEWEAAWREVAGDWRPTPANTLPEYQKLRAHCLALQEEYVKAQTALRALAEALNHEAAKLDDANTAWYRSATVVFPKGTPEGDLIRSTVPTTYTPPKPKADPAASEE